MSSAYRPTLYMPLYVQHTAAVQGSLFRATFNIQHVTTEPACTHLTTQPQRRFDGSIDNVCTRCGDTTRTG